MRRRMLRAPLLLTLSVLLLAGVASAQIGFGFDLSWNVLGGGGGVGPLAGSGYSLNGTLGQTAIGPTIRGPWLTAQGYWYGTGPAAPPCQPVAWADFSWMPPTPTVGLAVTLTATATGTLPITFTWDLGDGTPASGITVTHAYATADIYTVVLTATNCVTGTASATHTITVVPPTFDIYLPVVVKGFP